MIDEKKQLQNVAVDELLTMFKDTSQLVAQNKAEQLVSATIAAQGSNALADKVEFWKWMERNYSNSGIFASSEAAQKYIASGTGKEEWVLKQLQGKGYEWDWMQVQRRDITNIFRSYDAGDVATRAASDVTELDLISGNSREYQMKAYTGKTNPNLKNTPKDMTVVTNSEKVAIVKKNGYDSIDEFQNIQEIKRATHDRMEQIKDGKLYTSYDINNVTGTMARAGLIGCVIGMGSETLVSYKEWKQGRLTDEEYIKDILMAGGEAGATAGATAGIMIPVSAKITEMGLSDWLTIPVAIVVSNVVNKVIAPCFGRGEYRRILSESRYYQSLEKLYDDLISNMACAAEQYGDFVCGMKQQIENHQGYKEKSMKINNELEKLYDSI